LELFADENSSDLMALLSEYPWKRGNERISDFQVRGIGENYVARRVSGPITPDNKADNSSRLQLKSNAGSQSSEKRPTLFTRNIYGGNYIAVGAILAEVECPKSESSFS
jgi:hypothetical protein